ncbi:Glucose-repressible alcohol dehydrogenase transcriptional effector CCR4, partial [Pseudoloma neurophilia]
MQEPLIKDNKKTKIKTPHRIRSVSKNYSKDEWSGLDLSSHGLKYISMNLFNLYFLKELYLQKNELNFIPKEISELKNLEILDISHNKLTNIPSEISKMINLKILKLNDNFLSFIPMEIGTLYQLEIFNLENNPLLDPFQQIYQNKGGISVINFCRENMTNFPIPKERIWQEN